MSFQWLVLGISGVTCGGKTSLAREIIEFLPGVQILSQDDYFLPEDSHKHILIPELNHFNWEILSSLDMEKMYADIQKIVENKLICTDVTRILDEFNKIKNTVRTNKEGKYVCQNLIQNKLLIKDNIRILLIEGFSIFNYQPIEELCHLKFYLTLSKETCLQRRRNRTYIPADVPGYFEKCIWPEHVRQYEEVKQKSKNTIFLTEEIDNKLPYVFDYLTFFLQKLL